MERFYTWSAWHDPQMAALTIGWLILLTIGVIVLALLARRRF